MLDLALLLGEKHPKLMIFYISILSLKSFIPKFGRMQYIVYYIKFCHGRMAFGFHACNASQLLEQMIRDVNHEGS